MGSIFSIDSRLMRALNRIVDIVLLNIIFLITSIPVITIGASMTAMYSVTIRWAEHDEGYMFSKYFSSWKSNFKQSTVIWLMQLAMLIMLGLDARLCTLYAGNIKTAAFLILTIISVFLGISIIFAYPIIARFDAPLKNMLVNSICIPFSSIITAFTIIAITVVPFVIVLISSHIFFIWCYVAVMGWFALIAYANSYFLKKMFAPFVE